MKIILIATLTFFSFVSFSQGNLQFNQVKLVSTQETVPTGKVWKVESAAYGGGTTFVVGLSTSQTYGYNNNYALTLQSPIIWAIMQYNVNSYPNYIISLGAPGNTVPTSSSSYLNFPFWLPAGTTLAASTNMRYLSVIEFNIIP